PHRHYLHGVKPYGLPPEDTCFCWQDKVADVGDYVGNPPVGRTLTGPVPSSWTHDGTDAGICDLVGNIWDWVAGFRVKDGEIQIIPDNDSAMGVDESDTSPYWRAITPDGSLVTPGTPDTLKYDGTQTGMDKKSICVTPGGTRINTRVEFPQYTGSEENPEYGFTFMLFKDMTGTIEPPRILKELALYPIPREVGPEIIFMRSYGERVPARGASWYDGTMGGIWSLYLRDNRRYCYPDIGFRAAYIEL
ncbi:MAG: hypothetical protein IJ072_05975, partial [Oscillospiraceae bacterium]|nr:hypothetical protein [Oscillospiraceae bacterium]